MYKHTCLFPTLTHGLIIHTAEMYILVELRLSIQTDSLVVFFPVCILID